MDIKGKKVLLVGLGVLGGGTATANFLLREGADLTITDLKNRRELSSSLKKIKGRPKLVLGEHKEENFKENDIIVFGSGISYKSKWASLARRENKQIENDYTLFTSYLAEKNPDAKIIGITGTRGKTTVSNWIQHLIPESVLGGNIPEKGLLDLVDEKSNLFILELSSFQLEFAKAITTSPHIAIIINIYKDHMNRYETLEEYMDAKANIFSNQNKSDFLILNNDNQYTDYFLNKNPKSNLYFTSTKELSENLRGIFTVKDGGIFFQEEGKKEKIGSQPESFAEHKKINLLFALLTAYLYTRDWRMVSKIETLPEIPLRQQVIYDDGKIIIINDSAATIPEATVIAIAGFSKKEKPVVLVAGGTDKNLDFSLLAEEIKRNISKENLFLLKGSATDKLVDELRKIGYFGDERIKKYLSLEEIIRDIQLSLLEEYTLLFSPGAASFELFENEVDRGNIFNKAIEKYYGKPRTI